MKSVIFCVLVFGLTACGGNGGGSGAGESNSPSGSAVFENLSLGSSVVQCVKSNTLLSNFAVPSNSVACSSAGGIWHATNMVSTADTCRLSGVDFYVSGGGAATSSHQNACANVGGSFIAAITENKPYCSGYTPITCSGAGGTPITLDSTTGDINQSSVNFVAGNNIISSNSNLTLMVHGFLDGMNVNEYPVYFSVVSKITYSNLDFWTTTISKPTGNSFSGYFGYNTDTPSFTVSLPVGTNANIKMESATLYTHR